MDQKSMFGAAQWICAGLYPKETLAELDVSPHFPIYRKAFTLTSVPETAELRVLGLGFFHVYINGTAVNPDTFLPLSTDYEARENYPPEEILTGHRIHVPCFDVAKLLKPGKNVLALHFGGGWYTFEDARFGAPKAIFRLLAGDAEVVSGTDGKIGDSQVKTYHLTTFEQQDLRGFDEACLTADFDDSAWPFAVPAEPLDTEYGFSFCPADTVDTVFTPWQTAVNGAVRTYAVSKNITGYPVLRIHAPAGEEVLVRFSEALTVGGTLDERYHFEQVFRVISDGTERLVQPEFTWFGFSAFTVEGDAEPVEVKFIHLPAPRISEFSCASDTLNWLYDTFCHTVYCNMHAGQISDCPHIERRGYTGDGELTCHAVMNLMDTKAFYEKWILDIGDCQDTLTGHVQYTAPYTRCGGGPGAWGDAIVEVPWQYWKQYGDLAPAARLYPQMLRYFEYMEAHSVNKLVVSDKPGEWCLGDWLAPDPILLPAPFVNNYCYIKAMQHTLEMAEAMGRGDERALLEARIAERKAAITAAYFNTWDGTFLGGVQGGDAFAVDLGLGDERTYAHLVSYYTKLGHFDTGIIGTDVVTRVLFEHGDGELAVKLLKSQHTVSFEGMRKAGATTLWENWPGASWDRSRNHHMFGAVTAYLTDYLLGIRQEEGSVGYEKVLVAPYLTDTIGVVEGSRTLPCGTVRVKYTPNGWTVLAEIDVDEGVQARFTAGHIDTVLHAGHNAFVVNRW